MILFLHNGLRYTCIPLKGGKYLKSGIEVLEKKSNDDRYTGTISSNSVVPIYLGIPLLAHH